MRGSRGTGPRACCAALVVLALSGPSASAQVEGASGSGEVAQTRAPDADDAGSSTSERAFDEVSLAELEAVLSPPASGPEPDLAALGAALEALGPRVLGAALAVLCGELQLSERISEEEAVHPVALRERGGLLAAYVSRADESAVVHHLRVLGCSDVDDAVKRSALRLLGDADDAAALHALVDVAATLEPISLSSRSTHDVVADGIAHQLRERFDLRALAPQASQEGRAAEYAALLPAIASGVASSGLPGSLAFLATLLEECEGGHEAVLRELERCAREGGAEADSWTLEAVRARLVDEDGRVRRAAAAALGSLHDVDAVPALAELLADDDSRVALSARSSLKVMAAVDLGPDPAAWLSWFAAEGAWWDDDAPSCLQQLVGDDPAVAHTALRSLLEHPLWRHELAQAIGPLLRRLERPIAVAACDVLVRLGSRRAVPDLVELLVLDDPELGASACAALRSLTGLDLPPDVIAWSERLDGSP